MNRREKENVEEHKEKLKDFAFNLHEKDTIISEIQTQNGIQESDGFITIFRDVCKNVIQLVRPKEENVRLMNEIETLKSILVKLNSDQKKFESEKQELLNINFVFFKQFS